jgi:LmbE family N-acetylglucosaminyl deacetylase
MTDNHSLLARLAACRAHQEQEAAGFCAALAAGREPTPEQQRAYTTAGHFERMKRRRWAREGRLGPVAQAEQLLADAQERGATP